MISSNCRKLSGYRVPPDTQQDDLSFEVSSFEQRWSFPSHAAEGYQAAPMELQHFVRPYGAKHQWVKVPHQEFSVCLDS